METLDINALFNIAKNLPAKDILSLCQTSNQMKKVCDSRLLWEYLLIRDYGVKIKYQPGEYLILNIEQSIYENFVNDTFTEHVFIKYKNNVEYIVEFGIDPYVMHYIIFTPHGEVFNYMPLTSTYTMLTNLSPPGELRIDFSNNFYEWDDREVTGMVQIVSYNHTKSDRAKIYPQIINFLTNEGYVLRS